MSTPEGRRADKASRRAANGTEHWLTPGSSPDRSVIVQCDICHVQGTGEVRRGVLVAANIPHEDGGPGRLIHAAKVFAAGSFEYRIVESKDDYYDDRPDDERPGEASRRTVKVCGGTLVAFDQRTNR